VVHRITYSFSDLFLLFVLFTQFIFDKQNASRQTTQDNETLFPNWQKEPWEISEETSEYVDRNGSTSGLTP